MNRFSTILGGKPTEFEVALSRRGGIGGLDATLRKLKAAEVAAMEHVTQSDDPSEWALVQRYIEAISCARLELERIGLTF
ncbi:hypothetical protein C5615_36590 [Burkholderia cepacia]|uniref:Uncharacterized protein n=1 Tax=Burkholderia cepacia TaxID=292 RepID=A0A2S8I0E9_BURCE|nr:hypothetical protein [Burkholderia cepacia]PQP08296.1 hypothetical protein C5615_36590 [Burkholderia cepacia]HDR9511848.1 hypothetical protein [Burkholderia cepacia]